MFDWLKVRKEVRLVESLILNDKDWVKREYTWFHPAGVCIWVKNRWYGIDIKFDAKGPQDYATQSSPNGGFRLTKKERLVIGKAIEDVESGKFGAESAAHRVAEKINAMYGT